MITLPFAKPQNTLQKNGNGQQPIIDLRGVQKSYWLATLMWLGLIASISAVASIISR